MAEYEIVDLTAVSAGQRGGVGNRGVVVGTVESSAMTEALRSMRDDLNKLFDDDDRMRLKSLVVKLSVSAEGKVAFIAKGAAEASIELTFERPS
jgi:hypothetical protein